jgi:glycosyltransferase involved in cell wall biosynthesis
MDKTAVDWIRRFKKQHGRAPRVLHIGNIANNAYKNAQMLRKVGIDCDVLCHNYYHIMGTPEWEDADFQGDYEDQFFPVWYKVNLRGFKRPRWFVQGTFETCLEYLIAKNGGDGYKARRLWQQLGKENRTLPPVSAPRWYETRVLVHIPQGQQAIVREVKGFLLALGCLFYRTGVRMREVRRAGLGYVRRGVSRWYHIYAGQWGFRATGQQLREQLAWVWLPGRSLVWAAGCLFFLTAVGMRKVDRAGLGYVRRGVSRWYHIYAGQWEFRATYQQLREQLARVLLPRMSLLGGGDQVATLPDPPASHRDCRFVQRTYWLMDEFNKRFPNRSDHMTANDLVDLEVIGPYWDRLFQYYDLVQAYSTDPIIPLMVGKRPYVAFEHGTLRDFTLGDSSVCRRTALAYNMADHVFITNGDCLEYAKKIGVERYSPMLHPIDERRMRAIVARKSTLQKRLGRQHIFLCPLRHDWAVKGTDQYIRALPEIRKAIGDNFMMIMTTWGAELEKSRTLAEELGVPYWITWWEPLPRLALLRVMRSVDIVFDQLALPHFGATAPEAIAAGVPVISSYQPESTAWLIPEPAPILAAFDALSIAQAVKTALTPQWLAAYEQRARDWFDKYHASALVIRKHLEVYGRLLDPARNSAAPTTKEMEHDQYRERA